MRIRWGVLLSAAMIFYIFALSPNVAKAQYPALPGKQTKCDEVKDSDRRNLCLAMPREESEDEVTSFGYKRKDHSNYYCTLISNVDLQNLCYAVVGPNPSRCELIGDQKYEKECKAQFKK